LHTIHENHLPYVSGLEARSFDSIDLVVIHCTELPDLATARNYGQHIHYPETGTGNSGHYYIERNGRIEQWIPLQRTAHHVRGFNERSIGIELDNNGRYPDWFDSHRQVMTDPYPVVQIDSLVRLLQKLSAELPNLEWVAGHESLDTTQIQASDNPELFVFRKRDPGPLFPWDQLLRAINLEQLTTD
jgi:N-acetylmuramoyl-L-alanine amidase